MSKNCEGGLPLCASACSKEEEQCGESNCRYWIDYPKELNCSLISIYLNGSMTLSEVAKRLDLSLVRISQIEKQALKKLSKR